MAGLKWLTHAEFADRVGESFGVDAADGTAFTAELVAATEGSEPGGPGPDGQERQQFSLVFRGPAEPTVAQGIHRLTHDELGELELFLVPLGRDDVGMRYEAAFA